MRHRVLLFAGKWREALIKSKRVTIRKGDRPAEVGDRVCLQCPTGVVLYFARIVEVWRGRLGDVPEAMLEADGFEDAEEALEILRGLKAYRDLGLDSRVTVIEWMPEDLPPLEEDEDALDEAAAAEADEISDELTEE